MTGRRLLLVWVVSLVLAVAGFQAMLRLDGPRLALLVDAISKAYEKQGRPDVVFIGSSLVGAAIPPGDVQSVALTGMVGSGRLRLDGATQSELLTALSATLTLQPKVVILDASPLIFGFSRTPIRQVALLLRATDYARRNFDGLLGIGGAKFGNLATESEWLARRLPDIATHQPEYRLILVPLDDLAWMRQLVARAKDQGIRIILFDPPRSESAAAHLRAGPQGQAEHAARELGTLLEVEIFQTANAWPNAFFADSAHLNQAGRQRILTELSIWWDGRK